MTPIVNALLELDARPVIAHRGSSAAAPENTIAAFERAAADGAAGLELDVHVTADGVPVVIHDPLLDRTTDRSGAVASMSFRAVREADAGARFTTDGGRSLPWRGRDVRVPALAEVLDAFAHLPIIIEVKTTGAALAVRRVLTEASAADRCLIASFDARALAPFDTAPWVRSASRRETIELLARAMLGRRAPRVGYRALTVPTHAYGVAVPMRRLAHAARAVGCPTHVWVIDSPSEARALWKDGVAGIITNRPRAILDEA